MNDPSLPRVLCLRPKADFDKVGVSVPETLNVEYAKPTAPELLSLIAGARALVIPAVGPKLTPDLFEGSPVELVQVTGAGVDRLDRDGMERLGIPVANVPGGSNAAVAEYAISTTLVLLRRFAWSSEQIAQEHYEDCRKELITQLPPGLGGLTVGIVGLGAIGLAVAEAFHRFGARIVYHDPALTDTTAADAMDAERLALDELLRTSDVVSLHVPLLPQTRNLIDAPALATMKPHAVLINAARGGVVDEAALVAALRNDCLAGAAVDVFSEEPAMPDNPLLAASTELTGKLLVTPHIAGITRQAWATLFMQSWQNVEAVLLQGKPPQHQT